MSGDEGVIDPDTRESISSGRETIGSMLGAAQSKGRRVFAVFLIGLLVTIWAMRAWIWPILKSDLLATGATIIAITPFEVILLQAKIGIFVGLLLSLPFFLYYAREPLKRRGWYPKSGVASWKLAIIGLLSVFLFVGGVVYSYTVFFPVMFEFLANNAINANLKPTYSIAYWTQFIFVLGLSFGLAAQLPLIMTALSYAEIIPYETFRDKWKYAVVLMFVFGAVFSPPDPFTQAMWAGPLVVLYGVSLYITRFVVGFKRGADPNAILATWRAKLHRIAAGFVLVAGLVTWFLTDGIGYFNDAIRPQLPGSIRPGVVRPESFLPLAGVAGAVVVGIAAGLLAVSLIALYYAWNSIEAGGSGPLGDPTAIDLDTLDAEGVRAAPPEAFAAMDEETALRHANEAMEADEPEKARAILDRHDAVAPEAEDEAEAEATEDVPSEEAPEDASAPGPGRVERATAGFVEALREEDEEDIEDDIGGYYHDLRFIFNSLRSKAFRIFFVFLAVTVAVFTFLYSGGIGTIKRDFLSRLPEAVHPEEVSIVTLHPVEAIVFEVKIAALLGAVATLPPLLYYSWPALRDRGLAGGNRNVFYGWAAALAGGVVLGSALGYLFVAPAVVSYLVWDALQANMIITYRVNNFFWLVFFTTVGIGLWLDIPVTMVLFHRAKIVSFETMRRRWRVVAFGIALAAALFTPSSVITMIAFGIPVMLGYGLGLLVLWLYTLGGRRG